MLFSPAVALILHWCNQESDHILRHPVLLMLTVQFTNASISDPVSDPSEPTPDVDHTGLDFLRDAIPPNQGQTDRFKHI
jgi:hypothetical protein